MAPKTETATAAPANECKCGCGQTVTRNFAQGHDQKLVSTLAENIVNGKPPTGNGALSQAKAKRPVEERIELVAELLTKNISEGISAKFEKAALRKVEANERKTERADKKRESKENLVKAPRKSRAAKAATKPAEEPEVVAEDFDHIDPPAEDTTIAKRTVGPAETARLGLGANIKIKVRNRVIDARVAGLNQSGKVSAAIYNGAKGVEPPDENPFVLAA